MITLYNPHIDDFSGCPIQFRLLKRRALKKYGFLLNEKSGVVSEILVDSSQSSFIPKAMFLLFPKLIRRFIVGCEVGVWRKINNCTIKITFDSDLHRASTNSLFCFSYKSLYGKMDEKRKIFSKYDKVFFHLSHYFVDTSYKSSLIRSIENSYLCGENDISKNEFFKTYFDWYKRPFLILPFEIGERFDVRREFSERKSMCVATGSFHRLSLEYPAYKYCDYINTSGHDTYHPLRKYIFESESIKNIDSFIKPYRDYTKSNSKIGRFLGHFVIKQASYFSVDIVELYNSYKFAVVGEEYSGFVAIGALEAMKCGCVVMSPAGVMDSLGFEAGKHYIQYSNGLSGLLDALSSAMLMSDVQLNEIAGEGNSVVCAYYSSSKIASTWRRHLNSVN